MPTYEYECTSCGKRFELFQSMTEAPKKKCAYCSRLTARRLIGAGAAILFKGSGFYQTDYRSSEYRKRAKQEAKNDGGGTPESEKKSDSATKKTEDTG